MSRGLQITCYIILGGLATACFDPPDITKTVLRRVSLPADRCAAHIPALEVSRNDKVSWSLVQDSAGYLGVEEFNITFADTNPTYCVDRIAAKKNLAITCTVKTDSTHGRFDYRFTTFFDGGTQSCVRHFQINIVP